jgi:hypothetical protein
LEEDTLWRTLAVVVPPGKSLEQSLQAGHAFPKVAHVSWTFPTSRFNERRSGRIRPAREMPVTMMAKRI